MYPILKKLISNVIILSPFLITACPKTIFITRHAEKTKNKQNLTFESWHLKSTKPLSERGWQRAYGLAPHFTMDKELTKHGSIKALFAPQPNDCYNSVRPIQTLTPLADKLHLTINTEFSLCSDDMEKMAKTIMTDPQYHDQVIWIAYEHRHIPFLTQLFQKYSCNPNMITTPHAWNNKVFDRIWLLEFDPKSNTLQNFKNLPQRLLIHDSEK